MTDDPDTTKLNAELSINKQKVAFRCTWPTFFSSQPKPGFRSWLSTLAPTPKPRAALIELVNSIPDEELAGTFGAQIALVT